jgi:acyl-coenzyme A synthetase/AMP-(fatty) acid ligase
MLIVDEMGNSMEDACRSNPGILACEGPTVMLGYWNDSELTASVLKNRRLLLADIGYRDEEGFFVLLGRRDDVINTGGRKVAPSEIEAAASEVEGVEECACVPIPDKTMGSVAKLYVVIRKDANFSQKKIFDHLTRYLEPYKLPRCIEQIDMLPKVDGLGKVRRNELKLKGRQN